VHSCAAVWLLDQWEQTHVWLLHFISVGCHGHLVSTLKVNHSHTYTHIHTHSVRPPSFTLSPSCVANAVSASVHEPTNHPTTRPATFTTLHRQGSQPKRRTQSPSLTILGDPKVGKRGRFFFNKPFVILCKRLTACSLHFTTPSNM
jgi:hypothetical protein